MAKKGSKIAAVISVGAAAVLGLVGGAAITQNKAEQQIAESEKSNYTAGYDQAQEDSQKQFEAEKQQLQSQFEAEKRAAEEVARQEGFQEGLDYVEPEPEIATVAIPNYAEWEGCPDDIASATKLVERSLSDNLKLVSGTYTYVANFTSKTLSKISNYSAPIILDQTDKVAVVRMASADGGGVHLLDKETLELVTINARHPQAIAPSLYKLSESKRIMLTCYGTYVIDLDLCSYSTIESTDTSVNRNAIFKKDDTFYYKKGASVLNAIDLTTMTTSECSGEILDGDGVLFKHKDYILLASTETAYTTNGIRKLSFLDNTITTAYEGSGRNYSIVFESKNKVFISAINYGTDGLLILDKETGTITSDGNADRGLAKVYEDETFVVVSKSGGSSCVRFINKSTEEIFSSQYTFIVENVLNTSTGYLILSSFANYTEFNTSFFKSETQEFISLSMTIYDTVKDLQDGNYQLTSSTDDTIVGIFNEKTVSLMNFVIS